jgi:hypothetical protein
LILWVSFAWGLPAEPPVNEGEADVAADDPWAGVRISDAYDFYAKCLQCGKKNETRAESCSRCGYELPQPSAAFTYPPWVFVPGEGYYREGTLLVEPAKTRKGYWITGVVLTVSGLTAAGLAGYYGGNVGGAIAALPCLAAIAVGVPLFIKGVKKTKPVYAFTRGERFEPCERRVFALRSADSDGVALKVELTVLGF